MYFQLVEIQVLSTQDQTDVNLHRPTAAPALARRPLRVASSFLTRVAVTPRALAAATGLVRAAVLHLHAP